MKSNKKTLFAKDLQSLVDLQSILRDKVDELQAKLTQIKQVKNYTDADRECIANIAEEIGLKKHHLAQFKFMESLTTDIWVKNGSPKPGKVVNLGITEDGSPAVEVDWVKSDRTIVTIPTQLKIVREEELAYHWTRSTLKLARSLEPTECEDIEILNQFKERACESLLRAKAAGQPKEMWAIYENRIKYCSQRIELLTAKKKCVSEQSIVQTSLCLDNADRKRNEQEKVLLRLYGRDKSDPILQDVSIDKIICDPQCQQREQLDSEVITDYTKIWLDGGVLPAIKVMQQGEDYWLYDGFHTIKSARIAGLKTITAEVQLGTLRDAILASVGVNANHGLRRSRATKRNAVMTLLKDKEWGRRSNVWIAKQCKVSEYLVRDIKKEHPEFQRDEIIRRDRHGNVSEMNIEQIGSSTNGHFDLIEVKKDNSSTNGHFDLIEVKNIGSSDDLDPNKNNVSMMLKVGQIVQIVNSDRIDKRLVGYKNSYASITSKYEHSVDLKIWKHEIKNVSTNDIKLAPLTVPVTVNLSHEKLTEIMNNFSSLENLIESHCSSKKQTKKQR